MTEIREVSHKEETGLLQSVRRTGEAAFVSCCSQRSISINSSL